MTTDSVTGGDTAFVGRDEELALVTAALERGGCVLAGSPGVGKSRLASEAVARHGAPAVRAVATAAAMRIPFGAFAHVLTGVDVGEMGPLPAYAEALRQRSPDQAPTVLVDDAHLLDDASAAFLFAVCQGKTARVVVTMRHGVRTPDAITALWKERRLDRLDLEPLSRRELGALIEAFLDGPAAGDVRSRVFTLTEGNPLYTCELLIDAQRSGALAEVEGRWRWTGRPPQIRRLRDVIEARTRDLTAEGRSALELLAVGAPLKLYELAAVSGEDAIAELEQADLATVSGGSESPVIGLAHPMFGEVTLAGLAAATARKHRRRLAAAIADREPTGATDILRLATLKLESGQSDPDLFLDAAAHALAAQAGVLGSGWGGGDPSLAIRLADAAGPGLEAALSGSRGRMALSRFAEVEERLAPLEDEAAVAPFDRAAEYLRTRVYALHSGGAGTAEALALLDRAATWQDVPDWNALRAIMSAWILHDDGRSASAVASIGELAHDEDLAPQARLDAMLALGVAYSRLGLTDTCEALAPELERLVDELEEGAWETGWARYMVDGIVRVATARDVPGVRARLTAARERAEADGNAALAAGLAMVLGRLELMRGHAHDAIQALDDAAQGLSTGDPRNGLGMALSYLARAYAAAGDPGSSDEALARAEAVARERPSNIPLRDQVRHARVWADVAHGRISTARDHALELADDAREAVADEGEAVYDALRLGADPKSCAARLSDLAERAESDLLDACATHARALAGGDAGAQLDAADAFAGLDLDLFAAEAAAGAARAFATEGRESSRRRAAALVARHGALCPGVRTPALILLPASDELTPREREVAALAATGRSNAQIAAELVLSTRTVETYVLRACRKLGVKARNELAGVLTLGE